MRGLRALLPARSTKLSLLLTAVRYDPASGQLLYAKGHEPRGHVWTDHRLYLREELVRRLQAGEVVAIGRTKDLGNDFEQEGLLRLEQGEDGPLLLADGAHGSSDNLGLPRF